MIEKQNYSNKNDKSLALNLILLLGLVSALGDITYETGRSISGPYLAFLGASVAVIGFVSGLGEFLGYALRLVSGYLIDRTQSYWLATFIGYGLLLSVPLLAYTNRWEWAVLLLLLERIGKAIRTPARDTILSHATHKVGRGWGFAIHEALDQIGAVAGPLIFMVAFLQRENYHDGFRLLWISAFLTILALFVARILVPAPEKLENQPGRISTKSTAQKQRLPSIFWIYGLFTFMSVAGFTNFQIISYHLVNQSVVPVSQIPFFYAVAMGVDALAALVVGKIYDKIGFLSLVMIPLVTLPIPFLVFSHLYLLASGGIILWGIVMAVHETIIRAAIADLIPTERRAFAYGIFNTIYGAAYLLSGVVVGILYDISTIWIFTYVVMIEIAALFVLIFFRKNARVAT
ncbi:arabinose efflux permease [Anaerolinea thermolimosa]|uniref:MFS transporter n=1 Tax=Anaerolinea thermolimosa TaxID=229919 RepID=UPI0007802012|nr:MFS transporter [Anaerolinea thermolimosa]GAP06052.1 arabinose efflux permease [Anaerolinea thermolimosa]